MPRLLGAFGFEVDGGVRLLKSFGLWVEGLSSQLVLSASRFQGIRG